MPQQHNPEAHNSLLKLRCFHFSVEDPEKDGLPIPLYSRSFFNLAVNCHLTGLFGCVANSNYLGHRVLVGSADSRS
jgi:hypothetical protein